MILVFIEFKPLEAQDKKVQWAPDKKVLKRKKNDFSQIVMQVHAHRNK